MMGTLDTKFSRFDQVTIITTSNVKYLSAPAGTDGVGTAGGTMISPKGLWQVSAAINNDLLLVKNNIVIRIPASDVLKFVEYDLNAITSNFGKLRNVEEETGQS